MLSSTLPQALNASVTQYFEEKTFIEGEFLFRQSDVGSGCYVLLRGRVYGLIEDLELGRKAVLKETYSQFSVLGVKELINSKERPFSLVCAGDVSCLYLSAASFEKMKKDEKAIAEFYQMTLTSYFKTDTKSDESIAHDYLVGSTIPEVDFMMSKAVDAHHKMKKYSEEFIDELINDVAVEVNNHADELASQTVLESGMGVKQDKVLKIGLGTIEVAKTLIGQDGIGTISDKNNGVQCINTSMGVVFGMIPITNAVETIVFKFLSCLKSRNAIVISSNRKGRDVGLKTVQLIQKVLQEHGAPVDLIQAPQLPASRAVTNAFMGHKDVNFILATGGPSMVKSAYTSGTPAIGVGKGNAPVWICADSNIEKVAQDIVGSKSFDNGIVCGSENNLLVDRSVLGEFTVQAQKYGAAILNDQELTILLEGVFSSGRLDAKWVGRSAEDICQFLGIQRDYDIKLILASVEKDNLDSPLLKEKLAPVLSVSVIDNTEQALRLAKNILQGEGAGHTAIIHCDDSTIIEQFAQVADVSRVLVNTPGTQGCIGAANGLALSWTLGCGTQGGGSTSDNVTYRHLMNVKRIAYAH
jgi:acetaldehyde dehydrogenase/alcohol dehydrogenase